MIKLKDCEEKCFARLNDGCAILKEMPEACNEKCPFYKPRDCEDWVRLEHNGEIWLMPREDYYEV